MRKTPGSIAVLHAAQLVTLAGPPTPRVGAALRELALNADGGVIVRVRVIEAVGRSDENERAFAMGCDVGEARCRGALAGL